MSVSVSVKILGTGVEWQPKNAISALYIGALHSEMIHEREEHGEDVPKVLAKEYERSRTLLMSIPKIGKVQKARWIMGTLDQVSPACRP
jgi:hypothetical protein